MHYLTHGVTEGRDPNELFDTDWYLAANPDVAAAGMNPLAHYLLAGRAEGRPPADPNLPYGLQVLRERQQLALELPELRQHIAVMLYKPAFVVFVEGPDGPARRRTVASLEKQVYPHWSVCDLASNPPVTDPAQLGDGVYVTWLRAGDVLGERALYAFASALNQDTSADLVYADEDQVDDDGTRSGPFYKPAWSPDYLESFNYIGRGACFRGRIAATFWQQCRSYYDFVLRFTEGTSRVRHIAEVLYHRPRPATDTEPQQQVSDDVAALEGRLRRTGRTGVVEPVAAGVGCYDIRIQLSSSPLVSIILPTAGKIVDFEGRRIDLLFNCLDTVRDRSTYRNLEFIIVDNGDLAPHRMDELRRRGCRTITFRESRVNIAKKMNLGVSIATGEMLLLLNDDIEPITPDWIERLLGHFEKPHVGLVGAKLLYPNGDIQHAGVVITRGSPDHVRRAYPGDDRGYFFSTCAPRNFCGVTGACMMTRAELYRRVGGFNEALAISYNDIDYCLRVRECGLTVVNAPGAVLTHLESASRAAVLDNAEHVYFHKRWARVVTCDPFYSERHFADYPANFEIRYNPRWL
jgi:GT2 family glycosyltransferase